MGFSCAVTAALNGAAITMRQMILANKSLNDGFIIVSPKVLQMTVDQRLVEPDKD